MLRTWLELSMRVSLLATVGFLAASSAVQAQTTAIYFDSDPGDYIGQGLQQTFTPAGGTLQAARNFKNGVDVSFNGTSPGTWWTLRFGAANNVPLGVGAYEGATRFAFASANALDVYGSGRGCGQVTGRFVVLEIALNPDGSVLRFAADFEQHCEDLNPGLFGSVRYNSTIADLVPFGGNYPLYRLTVTPPTNGRITADGIDCGGGAVACTVTLTEPAELRLTATPDPGYAFVAWSGYCSGAETIWIRVNQQKTCTADFVPGVQGTTALYIDSEIGDPVGQGQEHSLTQLDGTFEVVRNYRNGVSVTLRSPGGLTPWRIEFASSGNTPVAAGTYVNARSFYWTPLNALTVWGSSSCSESTGRFVVREIVYGSGNSIQRFSADFEQHCNDQVPGLFGAIRYHATASGMTPFDGNYPLYQLTMTVAGQGRVTGGGIDCGAGGATCQVSLGAAQQIELTAQPEPGQVFVGWADDCRGAAVTTVHVNGPKTCSARFEPLDSLSPRNIIYLDSEAGDFLGGGRRMIYSPLNSVWSATATSNGNWLSVTVDDGVDDWRFEFSAPDGQALTVGTYNNTRSSSTPFNGLWVSGSGRSCTGSGRFVIHELALGANGTVQRFAADFEQHCGDAVPGLFGAIRLNANTDEVVPFGGAYPVYQLTIDAPAHGRVSGGGLDCGPAGPVCTVTSATAMQATLTAVPDFGYVFLGWTGSCHGGPTTSVNVNGPKACAALFDPSTPASPRSLVNFDSQVGDYIGGGLATIYSPANSAWTVSSSDNGNRVSINVEDALNYWRIEFSAPTGQPLAVGTYTAARRYPFTRFNGLSIYGSGRGCNTLTGRFVILEIAIDSAGVVERFAADFEQHCGDAVPALFGAVRHNSMIPSVVPFGGSYPTYQLTIVPPANGRVAGTSIDCGIGVATQCERALASAAQATLTATPAFGYTFMGWTEDCSGGLTTTVHVNGPKRCGAVFAPIVAPTPRTILRWETSATTSVPAASGVLSPSNSQWIAGGSANGDYVSIQIYNVGPTREESWRLEFRAPTGEALQVGRRYTNAASSPSAGVASLWISRSSSSCSGNGEFTVRELLMSQGTVVRFAVDVVQTCSTQAPTLTALLQYNSLLDVANTSLTVEPLSLRFAALHNGATVTTQPSSQTVRVTLGSANVGWTAIASQPWIQLTPSSGTGTGVMSVGVNVLGGHPGSGSATGNIVVTLTDGTGTSRTINLTIALHFNGTTTPPIGFVDTPLQNITGVTGAIPMTGWALDDLELESLTICRAPAGGEAPGPDANCGGAAEVFVGNGVFIEGARPDVLAAYPNHPRADRAGWGFMLLTNMLPNAGNGTFVFSVYARDMEGFSTRLGTRTMTCDNAHATAPFGTIDTPGQGATINGSSYINFGWALTPNPKSIPTDGSTLMVYVDGLPIGRPTYNNYRPDIATLFAGLANSNGAVGYRLIDTTPLLNGLHTISWSVTDSAGVTSGLGSRYFRVANGVAASTESSVRLEPDTTQGTDVASGFSRTTSTVDALPLDDSPIIGRRGWNRDAPWRQYTIGRSGRAIVRGEEIDRFELALGERHDGYLRVGDQLRPLPVGSHLNAETGTFTWSPGVGFVGTYDLVFVRSANGEAVARREVRVILAPKGSGHVGAQVVIDTPREHESVAQPFTLAGWAADRDATTGTGIDAVHVWAYPLTGGAPVFLGAAAIGGARPDVAAVLGDQFQDAGWGLTVHGLTPGAYDLAVFAWSNVSGGFVPAQVVRVALR